MAGFVTGADRGQGTLFPAQLEDYVAEDNPVRVIDVFVDQLDLAKLGFGGINPKETGRPAYHPAVMLKIYVYGYLNRVQSSRRLERECQRNVEAMRYNDDAAQHRGASLRNSQVLDGLGTLPDEDAAQREDRDVAPRPDLQHEARHEHPRCARITAGNAGLRPKRQLAVHFCLRCRSHSVSVRGFLRKTSAIPAWISPRAAM